MALATAKSAFIVWLRPFRFFGLSSDLDLDSGLVDVFSVHIIDSFLHRILRIEDLDGGKVTMKA